MKYAAQHPMFDAVAEKEDIVEIDVQDGLSGGKTIYINVNGKTVARLTKVESLVVSGYARPRRARDEYEAGVKDGMARSASKPGDGDMGG